MYKHFISLQWKAFFRSASLGKSIALKILMGFLALYFMAVFLILGIGLYPILEEIFPDRKPLEIANQFFLVWLLADLVFRFMLQTLPVMEIKPLLLLPVRKRKVVNYVLVKSLFSFFNLLPLLLIVPFGIYNIYKGDYGVGPILAWMLAAFSLTLCVNYANYLLKKKFADNLKELIPYVLGALVLYVLHYFEVFSITATFGNAIDYLVETPVLVLVPVLMAFGFYKWNQVNLERRFYLDDSLKGKVQTADTNEFQWVRKFGDIAPFLQLDLKLIWRNKRPKTTVWLSFMFLAYGLIFYPNDDFADMQFMLVFVGIFITGIFMINFGQFIPAWDSSYFSMMMSQNIRLRKYLSSKINLITFSIIVLSILATPYVYFGTEILLLNFVCALYNIGVNVPVLIYAGSFNRKRIDLEKSPFMNYQGTGAAQWIVALPLLVIPILIFWLLNKFTSYEVAVGTLAGLGILGILLRNPTMGFIEKAYSKRKYSMVQGFKQTGE